MKAIEKNKLEELIQNQGFASSYEFAKIRLTAWLNRQLEKYEMSTEHSRQFEQMLIEIKNTENQEYALQKTIEKTGFSFEEYTFKELKAYWHEQIEHLELLILYYRHKYQQSDWQAASAKFQEYPFGIIEKEDDLWNWEDAHDFLMAYREILNEWKDA
jgi:DNA primase